jgi:hypothetical protein
MLGLLDIASTARAPVEPVLDGVELLLEIVRARAASCSGSSTLF